MRLKRIALALIASATFAVSPAAPFLQVAYAEATIACHTEGELLICVHDEGRVVVCDSSGCWTG